MNFLRNTVSLLAVFVAVPAALAVTARPSILNTANVASTTGVSASGVSRRMPTMTAFLSGNKTGVVSDTTPSAALYEDTECIDAYSSCIKGADACGPDFAECTTNVLFHAQMPDCISTLYQCSASGINSLFGAGAVDVLSNVATTNEHGEVTRYTYPTDGSVLGQMITAAAIANKYDMSTCVKRYSSCLRKDSVCGQDFELCTTDAEFRKQRVFCDSTLARCQADGVTELFGSSSVTAAPKSDSRVGEMISEGAALAAVNAVSTCYKVADQCILNACAKNPYKCFEGATTETVSLADAVEGEGAAVATGTDVAASQTISKSNVSAYIANSCRDTVGSNKYCYATFLGNGVMPTSSQLRDEDNQEEIYAEAYGARMNSGMKAKITELVEKFDTKAKQKCTDTIMACAQRTCGGGSGAACYTEVFGGKDKSINNATSREDIRTGCAAIVNTDPNCQYAAANPNSTGTYTYSYVDADAFDTLFPEYDDGAESDPIGVIAALNASLAPNYNDAAIASMKQQCRTLATSCVKSMCGADYVNCYRNRTDIYSSLTNTGAEDFDKSMNKVGGVLDYTIVLGLCVDTIQNASVCQEHLAIERNKINNNLMKNKNAVSSWGDNDKTTVRSGWYDAGSATKMDVDEGEQLVEGGKKMCESSSGEKGECNTMSPDGDIYSEPIMISLTTYAQSQAAETLFKDLIYDLEKEAQAKYNAKLTKQQNDCMAQNSIGGIMGKNDIGSTYMWARLKGNKVPADYQSMGLKANQFVASNELYGSFCRVRVTLHSDDPDIMSALNGNLVKKSVDSKDKAAGFKVESAGLGNKDWNTAYFAVGDSFVCGSWIPQEDLLNIANVVGQNARADKQMSQPQLKGWMTALGAIGLGTGGAFLGDAIQDGTAFSGLSNKTKPKKASEVKKLQDNCEDYFNKAMDNVVSQVAKEKTTSEYADLCDSNARKGYNLLQKNDKDDSTKWSAYTTALSSYSTAKTTTDKAMNVATQATALRNAITELQGLCSSIDDGGEESKLKGLGAGIGAGVGAIGGGLLGYYITDSIEKAQLDSAQQEAINEFMENVGSKIKCYIGPDEVGTYGEVVPTSME